jgi:hypothetical protein
VALVIDCVKPPSVSAMRAAGVTGLSRYLSTLSSDPLGKIIHKPEYDALVAAGFDVILNWEHDAKDWLGGTPVGTSHAAQAVSQARVLGYPAGCAIPGSADFDMTASQWATSCRAYAVAYSAGIRAGGYVAGVYGPSDVLTWCQQLGGFAMYWQSMSTAFSAGRNAKPWPGGHLRQRRKTSIGGADVDVNDVIQINYGQAGVSDVGALQDNDENWTFAYRRIEALARLAPPLGGPEQGVELEILKAIAEIRTNAAAAATVPAPVAMSAADRQAIIDGVAGQVGGKLDQVLARLTAAGDALDG